MAMGCTAIRIVMSQTMEPGQKVMPGEGEIEPAYKPGNPKEMVGVKILTVYYEHHEQKYKEDTTGQDTRTNQWQKTHHMLLWEFLHEEEDRRYDWYVKVDTDAVFIPSNFLRFAQAFRNGYPAYVGHVLRHYPYDGSNSETFPDSGLKFNAGGCYALNREALEAVGPHLKDGQGRCSGYIATPSEDAHLAPCLRTIHIGANNSQDQNGREYFLPFHFVDHYYNTKYAVQPENGKPDWFWAGKDRKNELKESTAQYPVAAHNYKEDAKCTAALMYKRLLDYIRGNKGSKVPPSLGEAKTMLVPLPAVLKMEQDIMAS